ncbi:MAG: hypothetical protein JWQ30_215 [Sediminibacterium sp.]|nr:hypothetical protein [Sediminibacterium sp.]
MGASWCGPCNAAILSWNQLVEENSSNEDLVFIAVSLDDKQDDWMKHMKKRNPKGLNLFAGGFSSSFAKAYEITAIPHYLLLDQSGKIVRYGAPGPASAEIRDALVK